MERFFNQEGWLYRFLNRLWDLIVLNVLFILTCIPIITIGASICALYTVTMKGVRKEDSYIASSYFKAFKENFKKGTLIWLLLLAVWSVLLVDIFLVGKDNSVLVAMGGAYGIFWLLITLYVFQLQARFYLTACRNYGYGSGTYCVSGSGIPGCAWLVLFPVCVCRIFRNCLV